ncbi:MAG: hypothetical protein HY901_21430, partial [Deltaproteobacteria bacterium]|nr:hypothetical protein [Deltaproteobacteria bacterium]
MPILTSRAVSACLITLLLFPLSSSSSIAAAPLSRKGAALSFKEIDRLAGEQKMEAAAKMAAELREAARAAGDEEGWARALVKESQLRAALHGYESAVHLLKQTPWPTGATWRSVLDLFYARQLVAYARAYSWEIGQRERVDTQGAVDLKAWTREQIYAEAQRAYQDVWVRREALGTEPVKKLAEFIEPNTFPEGVRSTLRDALSYLRVELLADTSGWRPEQSNEVYALDRAALIKGDAARSEKLTLDDPAVHPLLKLGAVLDDLEAWHATAHRRDAALEARLQRAQRLYASFGEDEDRSLVIADLEERLKGFADVPWWSWGMATLAELVRQRAEPGALVRARAIALEGQKRFPGTPGSQRCLHLVRAIEAPSYRLAAMAADAPGKRSIAIQHKNLPSLWLRAYSFDLEKRFAEARNYNLLPTGEEMAGLVRSLQPAAEWRVNLPATPDFQMHRTFSVPPMKSKGAYLIVASAKKDFVNGDNQMMGVLLVLTDMVLVERMLPGEIEVTALSGETGMPLPGVAVSLWAYNWERGHQLLETRTTGPEGAARFKRRQDGNSYFVFARRAADQGVDPQWLYFPWEGQASAQTSALVYTDRSVYRPNQKIYWKVVGYRGLSEAARWETLPKQAVTVSLRDANWQTVESKGVVLNEFGSAAGEFVVPAGRMLGRWAVQTSLGGEGAVQVEEYKRPTFEVSLKDAETALRLNREATLFGEARYYFGLPVASGSARFKVTRTPVYPWWWGWSWGARDAPARNQVVATGEAPLGSDGRFKIAFVPKGDERVGGAGKELSYRYAVSVDVTDEGGETRSSERSFRLGLVSVEAAIIAESAFFLEGSGVELTVARTDLNGAPRAGKGSYKLYALQQPDRTRVPADQPLPRSRAHAQEAPELLTPGDELRPRHDPEYAPEALMHEWPDAGLAMQGELTHDALGKAKLALGKLAPGAYRLRYETTDDFGARFETFKEIVVAGKRQTPLALPAILLAEESSVPVGGKARLFVHSGLDKQLLALDIYQAGRRVEQRLLVSGRDDDVIELPITEALRGGFAVQLTAVRDHQSMELSQTVLVPWDDKELKVDFASFRDRVRPGDQETWRVTVKAPTGRLEAGTAEVLAYMYDRSLDLFAPHQPPNVLSLYPTRNVAAQTRTSLGAAQLAFLPNSTWAPLPSFPTFQPDRLKFFDSYGLGGPGKRRNGHGGRSKSADGPGMPPPAPPSEGPDTGAGGMSARAMRAETKAGKGVLYDLADQTVQGAPEEPKANAPAPPAPPRTNFSETAFWRPLLLLNPDGSASIEFTVPDSVTSWKVWVHALTRDLRGGSTSREARSVKDLMVRPYLPRFLREGDEALVKVVVNNATDKPASGQVTLDLIDPESGKSVLAEFGLADARPQPFTAAANGGTNLTWTLKAPKRVGSVNIKAVASSGAVSDGELRPLPLLPSRLHLAQSRFVTVKGKGKRQMTFADLASDDDPTRVNEQLVVTLDAQLFYGVLTALPYLINYPYECT